MKERYQSLELAPELVHAYAQTFISRWDRHLAQRADGLFLQVEQPLTSTHVFRHLTAAHVGLSPDARPLCAGYAKPSLLALLRGQHACDLDAASAVCPAFGSPQRSRPTW